MRKMLRIIAAFIGGFILGQLFALPIGFLIDKIYGFEVTGGLFPLNSLPNILYAVFMGFLSGFFAGYIARRKGMLIGGILQFIPLIIMVLIAIYMNRDITQYMYDKYGVDLALWTWVSLIPGVAGGFCGEKIWNVKNAGQMDQYLSHLFWNASLHTDEENQRWCFLRAIEWKGWPNFVSQPIIPVLFAFYPWRKVVVAMVVVDFTWLFLRNVFINLKLGSIGALFVLYTKWPASLLMGMYFLITGNYLLAGMSVFWPVLISIPFNPLMIMIGFGPGIGIYEVRFMRKLGYGFDESDLK